jgi:hypothetical protein
MHNLKNLLFLLAGLGVLFGAGVARAQDQMPDLTELLIREVNEIRVQPFCCLITGEHPIRRLRGDTDGPQTMCQCETCQRWAFGVLQRLWMTFRSSPADKALDQVERAFLSISVDTFAHQQQSLQKADELGVLREWGEQRFRPPALLASGGSDTQQSGQQVARRCSR